MFANITIEPDYDAMSRCAAHTALDIIHEKPDSLICVATGASPIGLYAEMAEHHNTLTQARIVKLDEWGGLDRDDPSTCEVYIRRHILDPWHMPSDRMIGFDSEASDPARDCVRVREAITAAGGIDLCILGMGADGHIGLNYPAETLPAYAHPTDAATLKHAMLNDARRPPTHGLTLGMADVLKARAIVLVVNGAGKADAVVRLLSGDISTQFPASLLHFHGNTRIVLDQEAASRIAHAC